MCFPQFQILCLTFLNAALIAVLNGDRAKFAPGGIKAGGSRAGVNLGLADQGPNKLRTIYLKNHEYFKNSKPSVQFYWFL